MIRLALGVFALAAATPLVAQNVVDGRTAVSLSYGRLDYDLSGTGNVGLLAARVERELRPWLTFEGGVLVARPAQQFGDTTVFVVPELGLQVHPSSRVAPYLGVGLGMAMDFREEEDGGTITDVTASGAVGVRAWITQRFGARTELRVRGIGTGFGASTAEFTVGAALRL